MMTAEVTNSLCITLFELTKMPVGQKKGGINEKPE